MIQPNSLHARGQRDHAQVVGVHDGVDVTGQAQAEGRERDALREATAGGGALDVHGRAAGGLTDGAGHAQAALAHALDEPHRARGLTLAERGRRDRRHVDVLTVRLVLQAVHRQVEVHLAVVVAVGQELFLLETEDLTELVDGLHVFLGRCGDLPVFVFGRIW